MPSQTPQTDVPEQGQLVEVRRRPWLVKDVHPGALSSQRDLHHRVTLEAVDQQTAGQELQVVWEREVRKCVLDAAQLPQPTQDWDPLRRMEAFLLATRWSLASLLESLPIQSPFKGAIDPEDFQLEAVIRALGMPRVNLLIADFVGAGKTIEAGLVMQEMLARQRVRRVLVVCPASLQVQWQEEMLQKFALQFEIVDRDYVNRMRREYGMHVNAWNSFPRLITSMDFLKRIEPLNSFRGSLQSRSEKALRDWDLLIVDEAHNIAPQGSGRYVKASDRTQMVREILPHFEGRFN
ncbi:MAG TPA: SNF2-related protein [Acidobacteriota bacterium]|nr:SNF2-related protein [Acidobacteriota bacterium]